MSGLFQKKPAFMACLAFFAFFFSCERNPGRMCTQEYRMIITSVVDSLDKPIVLTESWTEVKNSGEKLPHMTDSLNSSQGNYVIITDSYMQKVTEAGTELRFVGKKDNATLVDETYVVKHDGCHISLVSGKQKIIVN